MSQKEKMLHGLHHSRFTIDVDEWISLTVEGAPKGDEGDVVPLQERNPRIGPADITDQQTVNPAAPK